MEETAERDPVARLKETIAALKQELAQRLASLEADEAEARTLTQRTCVYKTYVVVGCIHAQTHFPAGKTLPVFHFHEPCIRFPAKEQPDLDCLECKDKTLQPWGQQNMQHHKKRFPEHGVIFPVVSEELADADAELQVAHGAGPLRRPAHEVHALQLEITRLEAELPQLIARLNQGGIL